MQRSEIIFSFKRIGYTALYIQLKEPIHDQPFQCRNTQINASELLDAFKVEFEDYQVDCVTHEIFDVYQVKLFGDTKIIVQALLAQILDQAAIQQKHAYILDYEGIILSLTYQDVSSHLSVKQC